MHAPASIIALCETFAGHLGHFRSGAYNEAQLRQEFLDPFFKELGWDMDNARGLAPQYRDVIHEDALKIGMHTKAPDYAFTIHGQRKFFLEAKKPSVNIKGDVAPAYQLRRYAWSAKLPLSILSDFEEFAIYDTRIKPAANDLPSKARTFYCTFDQFPAKWDEIAAIFSRDAILKGSFDKYADSSARKKGTAEVDAAFLAEIERWRDILARNLALRNPSLSVRDLNFAVQKTIDRLVFLRICEDRGTEDYSRLRSVANGVHCYPRLLELFRRADERYNSGLFHFSQEKNQAEAPDTITPELLLDDKTLKDIIGHLYYPESPYEFSVLPADILGSVYERFLGKTIRLTDAHQAKIEEKPEVRKAGGVYYTPAYIVDYIVRNTLGRLLNGPDAENPAPIPLAAAAKLKVADIACGSGSFLIQAYQFLLDWHRDRYLADPEKWSKGKNATLYPARNAGWRLTSAEKKRILLANIHGVDIDAAAVEVTKLSLLLKVLEGETDQIQQRDFLTERQRILPDLARNIRCGNSLIGPDFYDQTEIDLLDEDTRLRVNVFDWPSAFPEVFKQGGFDCVIGNPPYGAALGSEEKNYFGRAYVCQSYQLDSYLLFLEKAVSSLIREHGLCGYIIPNPWLTNLRQQATRKYLCTNSSILQIVHFYFPVFKEAVVDTEILILGCPMVRDNSIQILFSGSISPDGFLAIEPGPSHSQQDWLRLNGEVINIFLNSEEKVLFERIGKIASPLEHWFSINVGIKPYQVGKGTPAQNKSDVKSRPFDSSTRIDASYREILRGKDINRFVVEPVERKYLKYGPWLAEPRPAANFNANEKLLVRQTGDRPIAAIDNQQRLAMNNLHVLAPIPGKPEKLTFILGIINSRLLTWLYRCMNPEAGEALAEVKRQNVARLPIRPIDFTSPSDVARHDRMVALVGRMLELVPRRRAEKNPQMAAQLDAQIAATDRQIDRLVYELYGLTEDEIRLVEGISTPSSEPPASIDENSHLPFPKVASGI